MAKKNRPQWYGGDHECLPYGESVETMKDFWNIVATGDFDLIESPWDTATSDYLRLNAN